MKRLNKNMMSRKGGFTLIEILLVLTLLTLVLGFLTRSLVGSSKEGKRNATKILIQQMKGDLERFRMDCNRFPSTEQGLEALIKAPTVAPTCRSYNPEGYLGKKKVPRDAWDSDLSYTSDGRTYELKSLGADMMEGGEGFDADISSNDE